MSLNVSCKVERARKRLRSKGIKLKAVQKEGMKDSMRKNFKG